MRRLYRAGRRYSRAFLPAPGFLGNRPASGTVILDELGEEHLRTGMPIVYTSADSVFQIAAHEKVVPLQQLYSWCEAARHESTSRSSSTKAARWYAVSTLATAARGFASATC